MTLKEIVEIRLQQLGLGPVEAAVAGGLERTYIRDILDDRKKSVRSDKAAALAAALSIDLTAMQQGKLVPILGFRPVEDLDPDIEREVAEFRAFRYRQKRQSDSEGTPKDEQ